MSSELAIAAVTATLRNLLIRGIPDLPNQLVTTRPPDRARTANANPDQLNLFLYQTSLNAAWRNGDFPKPAGSGGTGPPPLALNLHYLITAFGQGDDDTRSHLWLGAAMRVLHDHPLLGSAEIRDSLADNDLYAQIERVRITPEILSLEEMSKLWTTFQTQYRISAAYRADVVLIESRRPGRAALPVLTRGESDRGAETVPGVSLPIIESVRLPNGQGSAFLGDELAIMGRNLDSLAGVTFRPVNRRLAAAGAPATLTLAPPSARYENGEVRVTLPDDAPARAAWTAGIHSVSVAVTRGARQWSSNELPVAIAPRLEAVAPGNAVARDQNGDVALTLTCSPDLRLAEGTPPHMEFCQSVMLLLGTARQVSAQPPPDAPPAPAQPPAGTDKATFRFNLKSSETGEYLLRLRVDGVDLPKVDRSAVPPEFDATQKVKIT
jgi:uncharacterized protein DUF4255